MPPRPYTFVPWTVVNEDGVTSYTDTGAYDPEKELVRFMRILSECTEKTNTAEGRRYLDDCFKEYVFNLPS